MPIDSLQSTIPSINSAENLSETSLSYKSRKNFAITPATLKPLPQIVVKRSTLKRKTTHTTVLTSTPYNNYLEEQNSKQTEEEKKSDKGK